MQAIPEAGRGASGGVGGAISRHWVGLVAPAPMTDPASRLSLASLWTVTCFADPLRGGHHGVNPGGSWP
jgi:hypothetical protein